MTAAVAGILANPGFEGAVTSQRRLPGVRPALKVVVLAFSVCLVVGAAMWGRADWIHAKAMILAGKGEVVEALAAMEAAGSLDAHSANKAVDRAQLRLDIQARTESSDERRELLEASRSDLELAAVRNPFDFLIATNLADVYTALNLPERALSEIRRALTLAPLYEEPRLSLALFHHRRREFRQAEEAYLWASSAGAANSRGTVTWLAAYRQLLMDTGNLPAPPAEKP